MFACVFDTWISKSSKQVATTDAGQETKTRYLQVHAQEINLRILVIGRVRTPPHSPSTLDVA